MSAVRVASGPLSTAELVDWYAVPHQRAGPTGQRPFVRASFITSLDGRATGPGGLSGGLNAGSAGDHAAFHLLRELADAVVVGAGTLRAEGYPLLEAAPLVVVTRSGDVPDHIRAGVPDGRAFLVGGADHDVTPDDVLGVARDQGWSHLALEGGPQLLADWLRSGLVDELALTVRPVLVGGDGPLVIPATLAPERLLGRATHLLEWEGDLLLRVSLAG